MTGSHASRDENADFHIDTVAVWSVIRGVSRLRFDHVRQDKSISEGCQDEFHHETVVCDCRDFGRFVECRVSGGGGR
jgi:hypothetical protein